MARACTTPGICAQAEAKHSGSSRRGSNEMTSCFSKRLVINEFNVETQQIQASALLSLRLMAICSELSSVAMCSSGREKPASSQLE